MNKEKLQKYNDLVSLRKKCRLCKELENPFLIKGGSNDSKEIGPFTRWQGNLNADILVVGQDWGDIKCLIDNRGIEPINNPTNMALIKLFDSIGINICFPNRKNNKKQPAFFTNAILCLKKGGLQAQVNSDWFHNCGNKFLKPTIDLINPKVLITLGEKAYHSVINLYGLPKRRFRDVVNSKKGMHLNKEITLMPVYHCGMRIQNTHRPMNQQLKDWRRILKHL